MSTSSSPRGTQSRASRNLQPVPSAPERLQRQPLLQIINREPAEALLRTIDEERIQRSPFPPLSGIVAAHDLKMQVWGEGIRVPGGTNEPDDFASPHRCSFLQARPITVQMTVHHDVT